MSEFTMPIYRPGPGGSIFLPFIYPFSSQSARALWVNYAASYISIFPLSLLSAFIRKKPATSCAYTSSPLNKKCDFE